MILCVTLNPCLDKTLTVPKWSPAESVRGQSVRELVGGKGNNVARALARLGRPARPLTFLGGHVGAHCADLLRDEDRLDPIVIATRAPTRVILTVHTAGSPDQTAFFDPDPAVTSEEARALYQAVESALGGGGIEAVTLSGSSPSIATHGLHAALVGLCRGRRVPVFLDTYGPALQAITGVWPDVIQVNRREAALHLGTTSADLTETQVHGLLDRWADNGVHYSIVTSGPGPVLANLRGRRYVALPPAIDVVNPIGSGDCLLAGLTSAWLAGHEPERALRHGLACAVTNALVWDAGAIDPGEVERWEAAITVGAMA
jgi:1-phosphofructokinase family hexose kinase